MRLKYETFFNLLIYKIRKKYPGYPRSTLLSYLRAIEMAVQKELLENGYVTFRHKLKLFIKEEREHTYSEEVITMPVYTIKCRLAKCIKVKLAGQEIIEKYSTPSQLYCVRIRKVMNGPHWNGVQDVPVRELTPDEVTKCYKHQYRG